MSRHEFRSNHENLPDFTPAQGSKRNHLKRSARVSVAVAALSSIILGSQVGVAQATSAEDAPRKDAGAVGSKRIGSRQAQSGSSRIAPASGSRYLVAVGDTVQEIAQAHGVTTAQLLASNGLSWKTLIFAGQQLTIPSTRGTMPSAQVGETIMRYNVKSGDTLKAIAENYGVPALAIMTANGLDRSSRLVVGQRLVIPDASVMSELPATR